MPDERPVTTEVCGWRQKSLFNRDQLRPYVKRRWRAIMRRLKKEADVSSLNK